MSSISSSNPRDELCRLELQLRSDPARVAAVRKMIEAMALLAGFDQSASEQIGLCLNEALANVIRHAYAGRTDKPIALTAEMSGGQLKLGIRDWGSGHRPPPPPSAPDPLTPGGVGLLCLKSLMDEVVYEPMEDGMLLTLIKRK